MRGCRRAGRYAYRVPYEGCVDLAGENAIGVCAAHLEALEQGRVRVHGRVPDGLTWELGVGEDGVPLEVIGIIH